MLKLVIENIKKVNLYFGLFFKLFEIKNKTLKKAIPVFLFFLALHFFYSYIGVYKYINLRPCSIHSSAQCQRASVALNYYKADMNFFKPRVQKFASGTGVTGLEFPIIYYTGAIMYKVFGFNEVYLKAISLILISLGLFLFYRLILNYLKNYLLALSILASAAISPVLMYYSPNIMPDAPSLGLVLSAWFFFFKFLKTNRTRYFNLFIILGTLAALIKVVSIICFVIVLCLLVLDRIKFFKSNERTYLFKNALPVFVKIVVGILIVFSWYAYANWLANAYNNPSFSLSPVMVDDFETLKKVGEYVKNLWLFQYYASETYTLLVGTTLFLIFSYKQIDKLLITITVLYILGSICFVFFFLNQFMHHDYYIISILPCVFFFLLTFCDCLNKIAFKYSYFAFFIFGIIIFFNLKECIIKCEENYAFRYDNRVYLDGMDYKPYGDLEPRLRALGIKRTDKTISGFDESYCSSLYLMDQTGLTFGSWYDKNMMEELFKNKEVKYLILNDSAKFNKIYPNDFSKNIILTHRGLIVYKLK